MDNHFEQILNGPDWRSKSGAALSVILFIISKLTISDAAGVSAILAAAVTTLYTCWKWYHEWKKIQANKRKNKKA